MSGKLCARCKEVKPASEFHRDKSKKDALRGRCKPCINERWTDPEYKAGRRAYRAKSEVKAREAAQTRRRREADPFPFFRQTLKRFYGMTPEQYDAMYEEQQGQCAICIKPIARGGGGDKNVACIDHDHACCPGPRSCGKCIRALLCARCNNGHFKDDPILHRRFALYIEMHRMTPSVLS